MCIQCQTVRISCQRACSTMPGNETEIDKPCSTTSRFRYWKSNRNWNHHWIMQQTYTTISMQYVWRRMTSTLITKSFSGTNIARAVDQFFTISWNLNWNRQKKGIAISCADCSTLFILHETEVEIGKLCLHYGTASLIIIDTCWARRIGQYCIVIWPNDVLHHFAPLNSIASTHPIGDFHGRILNATYIRYADIVQQIKECWATNIVPDITLLQANYYKISPATTIHVVRSLTCFTKSKPFLQSEAFQTISAIMSSI